MEIVAKSRLLKEQILDKTSKGCNSLELQLADELYTETSTHKIENLMDNNILRITDIYSVHPPLGNHRFDSNLEDVFSSDRIHIFYYTCAIAQKSSEIWHHPVRVVLHYELDFDKMLRQDYITKHILKTFDYALNRYPNLIFAIENVPPLLPKNGGWYLASTGYDDTIKLVRFLRLNLATDRFSLVLDTCHAGMSIKYMNSILGNLDCLNKEYTMQDFFKASSEYCDTIHLCTFTGDGYGKNHGKGFTDDSSLLKEYLGLWNRYTKNAALVLELSEDNYLNSINFLENSKLIKEILQQPTFDKLYRIF